MLSRLHAEKWLAGVGSGGAYQKRLRAHAIVRVGDFEVIQILSANVWADYQRSSDASNIDAGYSHTIFGVTRGCSTD